MKVSYLACDGDDCTAKFELPDAQTKSVPGIVLRRSAWRAGWYTDAMGRDYCPVCAGVQMEEISDRSKN